MQTANKTNVVVEIGWAIMAIETCEVCCPVAIRQKNASDPPSPNEQH